LGIGIAYRLPDTATNDSEPRGRRFRCRSADLVAPVRYPSDEQHPPDPEERPMTDPRTILYPTDFSENSRPALELACALARERGGRLVILHVVPSPLTMLGGTCAVPPAPEELDLDAQKCQLAAVQPVGVTIPVERRLMVGDPVEVILKTAEETGCGLIVLGTHGRTGLGRLLMGSVAEQVVRKAVCPVLTVKQPLPQGAAASNKEFART
jgi:nucleotide-binding universal stress UspA family protein